MSTRFGDELKELREALKEELANATSKAERDKINWDTLRKLGVEPDTENQRGQPLATELEDRIAAYQERQRQKASASIMPQTAVQYYEGSQYQANQEAAQRQALGQLNQNQWMKQAELARLQDRLVKATQERPVLMVDQKMYEQYAQLIEPTRVAQPVYLEVPTAEVYPRVPVPMAVYCPTHVTLCVGGVNNTSGLSTWRCSERGCKFEFVFTIEAARGFIQANWILNSARIEQQLRENDQADVPVCPLCLVPLNWTEGNKTWKCLTCPFNLTEGYLQQFRGGRTSRKFVMAPFSNPPERAQQQRQLAQDTVLRSYLARAAAAMTDDFKQLLMREMFKDQDLFTRFLNNPGAVIEEVRARYAPTKDGSAPSGVRRIDLEGD